MAKKKAKAKTASTVAEKPTGQRAIQLQPYLNRVIPYWGHPGHLAGARWRWLVKNQPIAIICRDTLIANMISLGWSIRQREPDETKLTSVKEEIDHYTELFNTMEGGFDNYISLIGQDLLDLPFGAMCEKGYQNDNPDERLMWVEHVDAATLMPTNVIDWPVMQTVPYYNARPVVFPKHAISRSYMSPRPEIKRKGWGMAPPEKIYLALEMLYRGDRYYANLLLDTPEAGILDLIDMSEEDATEWLESMRELFQGIDGFKVPVLYQHNAPAQWIPLNRPPTDLLYDTTTLKYATITAAGYGIRLSDIGMAELTGDKTLAGVIRGERQSRRNGHAVLRSKTGDHLDTLLPKHLQLIWDEKDEEAKTTQARALSTYGLALGQIKRDGLMSVEEARHELVATGLLEVEIDPDDVPEQETPMGMPGQEMFGKPGEKGDEKEGKGGFPFGKKPKPFGKPTDEERGKGKKKKVAPEDGGRGNIIQRAISALEPVRKEPGHPPYEEITDQLLTIVKPGVMSLAERAAQAGVTQARLSDHKNPIPRAPRLRRLIKVITRAMVPEVKRTFDVVDDEVIRTYWLPEMLSVDFGMPSELDSVVTRQSADELREKLEQHLVDDPWWTIASTWDKAAILNIFKTAYEVGLHDTALEIIRALYEEGLASVPTISPTINFDLTNRAVMRALELDAAKLVTRVNEGTKYFIKRITVAGVRQGLTRPDIAQAIREGESAAAILKEEGFMEETVSEILSGLIEMSEKRATSIVNTEINRAQNMGHLRQIVESGLTRKWWRHLGSRGLTPAGNQHPCPVCLRNEELGYVEVGYLFETVFKSGGPEDDGRSLIPPGHPSICHCKIFFDDTELTEKVAKGQYKPWTGGNK
jgi:hypothetical protein